MSINGYVQEYLHSKIPFRPEFCKVINSKHSCSHVHCSPTNQIKLICLYRYGCHSNQWSYMWAVQGGGKGSCASLQVKRHDKRINKWELNAWCPMHKHHDTMSKNMKLHVAGHTDAMWSGNPPTLIKRDIKISIFISLNASFCFDDEMLRKFKPKP